MFKSKRPGTRIDQEFLGASPRAFGSARVSKVGESLDQCEPESAFGLPEKWSGSGVDKSGVEEE